MQTSGTLQRILSDKDLVPEEFYMPVLRKIHFYVVCVNKITKLFSTMTLKPRNFLALTVLKFYHKSYEKHMSESTKGRKLTCV